MSLLHYLGKLQNSIRELEKLKSQTQCFFNYGVGSTAKGVVKFNENHGSSDYCGYEPSTGVFTTVIAGLYYFEISLLSSSSKVDTFLKTEKIVIGHYSC